MTLAGANVGRAGDLPPTRRLILANCAGSFDPALDVALGPWCFDGCEEAFSQWDEVPFVRILERPEYVQIAFRNCLRLMRRRLYDLCPRLNARHGTEYRRAYWHCLVGPWLLCLITATWSRWLYLTEFLKVHAGDKFEAHLASPDLSWGIASTRDFQQRLWLDNEFNHWLISVLLRGLAPDGVVLIESYVGGRVSRPLAVDCEPLRPSRSSRFLDRMGLPAVMRCAGVYGMSRRMSLLLSCLLAIRPRQVARRVDEDWGSYNPARDFPAAYLQGLDRFIDQTLPRTFGDDYARFRAAARQWQYATGRIRIGHPDYWFDEKKFITAEAIAKGERIVRCQHGAWYGAVDPQGMPPEFEFGHEAFITWGWTRHDEHPGRFVPLPSPLLSEHERAPRGGRRRLLFVGTEMNLGGDGLLNTHGTDIVAYRKNKVCFLRALEPRVLSEVVYRPYMVEQPLRDEDYLLERFPNLAIRRYNPRAEIGSTRLLVIDHYSTLLHVSMVTDTPTIMFWAQNRRPLSRAARPWFDALRACGVIFDTAEEAAAAVNEVWDAIDEWWQGEQLQRARRDWCEQFASTDRHWRWRWLRELWRL